MNSTYAQKSSTVQKAADSNAASVLDSSSQGESLQRKADMVNENSLKENPSMVLQLLSSTQVNYVKSNNQKYIIDEAFLKKHIKAKASKKQRENLFKSRNKNEIEKGENRLTPSSVIRSDDAKLDNYNQIDFKSLKKEMEKKAMNKILNGTARASDDAKYGIQMCVKMTGFDTVTTKWPAGEDIQETFGNDFWIVGPWNTDDIVGYHFEANENKINANVDELVPEKREYYPSKKCPCFVKNENGVCFRYLESGVMRKIQVSSASKVNKSSCGKIRQIINSEDGKKMPNGNLLLNYLKTLEKK